MYVFGLAMSGNASYNLVSQASRSTRKAQTDGEFAGGIVPDLKPNNTLVGTQYYRAIRLYLRQRGFESIMQDCRKLLCCVETLNFQRWVWVCDELGQVPAFQG